MHPLIWVRKWGRAGRGKIPLEQRTKGESTCVCPPASIPQPPCPQPLFPRPLGVNPVRAGLQGWLWCESDLYERSSAQGEIHGPGAFDCGL